MNDLSGMDLVPEPKIISAALKACRRVNDFALAIRYIEAVKEKCGPKVNEIYPYVLKVSFPFISQNLVSKRILNFTGDSPYSG